MAFLYQIVLSYTAISSLAFGLVLIADPSGAFFGLSTSMLAGTVFPDFRISGIILALVIGGLGMGTLFLHLVRSRWAGLLSLLTGLVLCGWMVVQLALTGLFPFVQVLYIFQGAFLSVTTLQLRRKGYF